MVQFGNYFRTFFIFGTEYAPDKRFFSLGNSPGHKRSAAFIPSVDPIPINQVDDDEVAYPEKRKQKHACVPKPLTPRHNLVVQIRSVW